MIDKTTRNILSIGGLMLVVIYFLKVIILAALIIGLVPMILIFCILIILKYGFKISRLKEKSITDIVMLSIGVGGSTGLILIVLFKIFYKGA